jgi:hypothetical protein
MCHLLTTLLRLNNQIASPIGPSCSIIVEAVNARPPKLIVSFSVPQALTGPKQTISPCTSPALINPSVVDSAIGSLEDCSKDSSPECVSAVGVIGAKVPRKC